ncbi:MAG: tetratricopeptide repeat protein [Deltaproteobacteria bacterium]|nr:tetratricopeptide repeat protein [Deltaproteobacteria bacterium]MBW2362773.1 tetratricopeptide repeat protein [Deltaproteobacteria bacterium]
MRARRIVALLVVACSLTGCASFEAARFYRQGTRALDAGDTARAVADLERAAQLVPHGSEIQNHLGLAYAAAGRDDAALTAFRRAVEIDCENGAAQHNLEMARRRAEEEP